jgi:hypothetical protein
MALINETNHPQTYVGDVYAGIFLPVLAHRFRLSLKCSKHKEYEFDYFTAQALEVNIKDNNSLVLVAECDTGGGVVTEFSKIRNHMFDLIIDNLDGNETIFYKEHFKGCKITNVSWSHDYAASRIVKLYLNVSFKKFKFELVTPKEIRYEKSVFIKLQERLTNKLFKV